MKDIKSFLIGFLTCACLFLFMGATTSNITRIVGNGKYQISSVYDYADDRVRTRMVDTSTGKTYKLKNTINPKKPAKWILSGGFEITNDE